VNARAQSETIGMVLLLGLTVIGTTGIVVFGSTALNDTENAMERANVENSMKQLDARASRVAIGGSAAQEVHIPQDGQGTLRSEADVGWINVTVTNRSDGTTTTVVNQSLGQVVYDRGGTKIAYQGGGIWRKQANKSVMLSSPEMHFRGQTLTLPIVAIDEDGNLGQRVRVASNGSAERKFPGTTGFQNPISGKKQVNVTIKSEYYDAWAEFMRNRAGGVLHVDHQKETVTLELVSERVRKKSNVQGAIFATTSGTGTKIDIDNGAYIASYNSSKYENSGDRDESVNGTKDEGEVKVSGTVKLNSGGAEVRGNVSVGNKAKLSTDSVNITGHLTCYEGEGSRGNCVPNRADRIDQIDDDEPDADSVSEIDETLPRPDTVEEIFGFTTAEKIDGIRNTNNNSDASDINGGNFVNDDTVEVGPGSYYLNDLVANGNQIIKLNLTKDGGGNITLAVDGQFKLTESAQVCVIYDESDSENQVRTFLAGGGPGRGTTNLLLDSGGDVLTVDKDNLDDPDYDCDDEGDGQDLAYDDDNPTATYNGTHQANKFWVYSAPGINAEFMQRTDFTGVVYAPDTKSSKGNVVIHGGRIYGAVVAQVTDMDQNNRVGAIYYDTALGEQSAVRSVNGVKPVKVSYLHVSVNRVNVSDAS
jgi:hypothetical protein